MEKKSPGVTRMKVGNAESSERGMFAPLFFVRGLKYDLASRAR